MHSMPWVVSFRATRYLETFNEYTFNEYTFKDCGHVKSRYPVRDRTLSRALVRLCVTVRVEVCGMSSSSRQGRSGGQV